MKWHWIEQKLMYSGEQLKPLFAYMNYGLLGDSIVGWQGPCEVALNLMVDGEDRRANAEIKGSDMVHFIVEFFPSDLRSGVLAQRLLASTVADRLRKVSSTKTVTLRRDGDDLFIGERKLTISIATVSAVSTLIHFAINVKQNGTPVPTMGLEDLDVDAQTFARDVMTHFSSEWESVLAATKKVFPK